MRSRWFAAACVVIGVCAQGTPAQAYRGLTVGFDSQSVFTEGSPQSRALWLARAAAEGASMIRGEANWAQIAPKVRPPGFSPSDPSSPGYNWAGTDAAVRDLSTHGIQVFMNVIWAPKWAEGPNMASVKEGTWRPDPAQFAAFATALARRYSGRYPDPQHPGSVLPRVRYWQPWNEPNLASFLNPQWVRTRHGYRPASPGIYRQLLNAFYAAVKSVDRSNFVVAAGTAPYGDPPGGNRIQPVRFYRSLFCLADNARLSPLRCPDPAHLDAVDDHAYGIYSPSWRAQNRDDTATPDFYKVVRVVKAAQRRHHVLPAGPKRFWDTEVNWDSKPPDPRGVPINRQARFVEQTMYILWSQGVNTVMWLLLADQPPVPSYATTYQGGMYYLNGRPKPAAQALRFPFVTRRINRHLIEAWGRSPQGGSVSIEKRRGRHWKAVRRLRVGRNRIFVTRLSLRGAATLRAQVHGQSSLTWPQSG